jgi:predicted alpha/beta-hydrolase family hydrolase
VQPQDFLFDGPAAAPVRVVLAHGAGAPMDSPFMDRFAAGLAERGLGVARFEFPYMRARRELGARRGPDRQPVLEQAWREAIAALGGGAQLVIGGKSLGGRIASYVADEAGVRGLLCLGYPFHPPDQPARLRTAHLRDLRTPTLVVQGTRDPFGGRDEVAGYELSPAIRLLWLEDGDHSWKPRRASGHSEREHLETGIAAAADFVLGL